MLSGHRQRAYLAAKRRRQTEAPANGQAAPALLCLRPLLVKTAGRHCVWFRGQVFSRHRSLVMARVVLTVVERVAFGPRRYPPR
jgi:hypothetical protein